MIKTVCISEEEVENQLIIQKEESCIDCNTEYGIVFIDGVINDDADVDFENCVEEIFMENPEREDITIEISSEGGSVDAGLQIVALIEELKEKGVTVTTICKKKACSMASLIFVSGDIRLIRKYSKVIIHPPYIMLSVNTSMTVADLRYYIEGNKKSWSTFCELYTRDTKITQKELNGVYKLCSDREYDWEECLEKRIATDLL